MLLRGRLDPHQLKQAGHHIDQLHHAPRHHAAR
jgi:hypothetical protein